MKQYHVLLCMILTSCINQFVKQPAKLNLPERLVDCKCLVELVNKEWAIHKRKPCHKEFSEVFTLAQNYSNCLEKLRVQEVIQLFGSPDRNLGDMYEYIFKKDCNDKNYNGYYYLRIRFGENGYLIKAESGLIHGIE